MKAELPNDELGRLESLYSYDILDTIDENDFDDITLLASNICQTPISLIGFIDKYRQWYKSTKGLNIKEISREITFCAHAILNPTETMVVTDTTLDKRFADNEAVTGELGIRFYAGTPLVNKDGYVLGTLCVIDKEPKQLTNEQIKSLEALGRQVMKQIEYRKSVIDLEKAMSEVTKLNNDLSVSEEKFKSLSQSLEKEVNQKSNALEIEKQKLLSLLTNAPAVIATWRGPTHIFEYANDNYLKTFGYRQLVGKTMREAIPEVEGQGYYEMLDGVYNTGQPFIGKEIYSAIDKNNDGNIEEVYWNFTYQPVYDENKQIVGVSDFAFDVTEVVLARKQVEELNKDLLKSEHDYRTLAESLEIKVKERTSELLKANQEIDYERNKLNDLLMNSPAMIAVLEGPDHIFKLSNHIFQKVTGNRNFINKPYREALPELSGQGFYEILDNSYRTGELFIGNEIAADLDLNDDGKLIRHYFNFAYQPTLDINQQVVGIGIFAFDVTQQVNARKEVEKLYNQVKISNKALQSFAYITSHDLQEPLRTIASYSQLLEKRYKDKLDDKANEFLDSIVNNSKRMKTLIEEVLNYSKISKKDNIESVDINNIVEDIKLNLKLSINESNTTLKYENLPSISAEKIHILQLFQNIIGNAIKYRQKDRPLKINISAKKENDKWLFSISDNGIGIDKVYSEKVFEVFKRLHGRNEYSGTGIGLANCKKIVELYDGKIWVEGIENQGSTFFFTLPAS